MGLNNEYAMEPQGTPWMVFDIETCPMPDCAQYLTDPIEAPSNYKDPVKIAAYIAEKKAEMVARAALDLDLCEVVAIGVAFEDVEYVQWRHTTSETHMLQGFWQYVRTLQRKNGLIVGFNVVGFDLPVLTRRSLYLDVPMPPLNLDRYRHDGIADVADVLSFHGRQKLRSLGFYAKRFGIPHDDSVKGEQIPQLVAEGAWDKVTDHVLADVRTTRQLAQRIGVVPSRVAVA